MMTVSVKGIRKAVLVFCLMFVGNMVLAQAPSITTQPTNRTACAGGNTTFSIVTSNATSYQWQVSTNGGSTWSSVSNTGIYSGATTTTLTLTSVSSTYNSYRYRCVATGSTSPAATSNSGTLTVTTLPTVSSTTGGTTCAGTSGQVSAVASTGASINWFTASTGGTAIGTNSTLTIPNASTTTTYYAGATIGGTGTPSNLATPYNTNNGQRGAMFDVTATNAITVTHFFCSLYTGTTANYEIYYRPSSHVGFENSSTGWTLLGSATGVTSAGNNIPTLLPIYFSVAIPAGSTYSFYITNDYGGGTAYTDGTAVGNYLAGNSDVTIYEGVGKSYPFGLTFNVRNINATMYYTTASGCASAVRTAATLTVNANANITTNPPNRSITAGSNTTFNVAATNATTYQWQVSTNSGGTWSNISNGGVYGGASTNTLNLTSVPNSYNSYQYRCIASNVSNCPDTSSAGTLSVSGTAPSIIGQPSNSTLCAGSNTIFSVTALGTSLTYQWQVSTNSGVSWTNVPNTGIYSGATTNNLSLTNTTAIYNGYQYRCVVSGAISPSATSTAVTLTVNVAPSITAQPSNSTICTGSNTSFSITAINVTGYQWQVSTNSGVSWSNLSNTGIYSGATTNTLSLTGATTTHHNYQYRCIATGSCTPTATSNVATLTISVAPAITAQPSNSTVGSGGNTSFSVTAASATSYQWQVSVNGGSTWSNLTNTGVYSGATTSTLSLTVVPASYTTYQYRCVVTGSCSPVATSNSATITVNVAPAITAQPFNSTICTGGNTTFSVTASNTTGYQWQVSANSGVSWTNVTNTGIYSGATTNTLSLTAATVTNNGYQYRCVATGLTTPNATSNAAVLTVNVAPSITAQPSNSTVCAGSNTTFSITASNATSYQWQVSTNSGVSWSNLSNTGIYSGATTSTLSLTGATTTHHNYQYRCIATGLCTPIATSNVATLTINVAPAITAQPSNSTIGAGGNTSFSVTAINATGYQWQVSTNSGVSWTNVTNTGIYSGATTNILSLTAATAAYDGYQYRCVATGLCTPTATSNTATLTVNSAPAITAQPSNASTCNGGNTSFSVTAINATGYQWQVSTNSGVSWSNLSNTGIYSNATTSTLSITGASNTNNGYQYRCEVTGLTTPNAISNAATLTINVAPAITVGASSTSECEGSSTNFSITASNATGYQWQVSTNSGVSWTNLTNNTTYSNVTASTLGIANITLAMNGYQYRCLAIGPCTPSAVSSAYTLTVNKLPSITGQPSNSTICSGANTSFTTTAVGTGLTYQWQVNTGSGWNNVTNTAIYSGATTGTLSLASVTATYNSYQYRCVVNGTCTPSVTTSAATLTINTPPAITMQPINTNVCSGGNTAFTTIATGHGLTYQWQVSANSGATWSNIVNGGVYSGATTAALSLTGATATEDGNQYRCVINGTCTPNATTSAATLSISSILTVSSQPSNSTICTGANTSFVVGASGTGVTYQWQVSTNSGVSWANLSNTGIYNGATTNTLSLTAATIVENGNQYRCVISSTCTAPVNSNVGTLIINTLPAITSQPTNRTICDGLNTSFSIAATGTSVTYQWQVSANSGTTWTNVSNTGIYTGATTNTLSLTAASNAENSNQYRCIVSGTCTPTATSNIAILTIETAPVIAAQPSNVTACDGNNAMFSITATGAALTYQWQVSANSGVSWANVTNTGVYSGATTNTLNLTTATGAYNNNQYRCIVSGTCTPTATSNVATLSINSILTINTHPTNSTICSGNNTTFSVIATASGLTYQWQVNTGSGWNNITNTGIYSGATTSTLSLTAVTVAENSNQYRCVLNSTCTPPANSNAATLTVNVAPSITAQASNSTICSGDNTSFSIAASGAGLTYQWQLSTDGGTTWTNVTNTGIYSGATTTTLSLVAATTMENSNQYRCIIGGICVPSVNSNAVTLTVNELPAITAQSVNSTICSGSNTSFSITTTGTGLTYQWQVNTGSGWTNVVNAGIYTGATTSTLQLTAATVAENSNQYRCEVNGTCSPSVTSNTTLLTVNTAPVITTQPTGVTICEGNNAIFNIVAIGTGLTYQWQENTGSGWTNVTNTGVYSGATTTALSLANPPAAMTTNQYRCVVGGVCVPGVNSNAVTLTVNTLPTITAQPTNVTICSGANTSFNVMATGTSLVYQWQVNTGSGWTNVSNAGIYTGATTNTLNLTAASTVVHTNDYRCVVSGACTPSITSAVASITVNTAPTITVQPINSTICEGNNTMFNITATGTGLVYQWQVNTGSGWTNVINTGIYSAATTNTLNLTAATTVVNSNQYRCIVSGTCVPGVTSSAATLTINTAPTITAQPINSTICEGNNTTFNITATGTGLVYQWQVNTGSGWTNVINTGIYSGATTNTLNLTAATVAVNSYQYRCVVSGTCAPSATSATASITVNTAPVIISQPITSTICEGGNTAFNIVATGTALTYQWQVNSGTGWTNLTNTGMHSGATTATLNITTALANVNGYQYRCVLAGTCTPSINSNAVTLIVNTSPVITSHPTSTTICDGDNTSFNVVATGAGLTYQWQVNSGSGWANVANGGIYSNATTATLNITSAPTSISINQYRCIVGGTCPPSVTSNAATLIVNSLPAIVAHPVNTTTCVGSNTSFVSQATGAGASYQWQVNSGSGWTNLSNGGIYNNVNVAVLSISGATLALNGNQYRCMISGTCPPTVTTNAATLTVNTLPSITSNPSSIAICDGNSTSFSVSATGTALTYQWQVNVGSGWSNIYNGGGLGAYNNTTTATLSINNASTVFNGFQYRCVVSGYCTPPVISSAATLTVHPIVTPAVSITASDTDICANTSVTFSVTSISNGGSNPSYQWKRNGTNVGTNSTSYTTTSLSNGDVVTCVMTTTAPCPTSPTATSNGVTMTVHPLLLPVATLNSATADSVCATRLASFNVTTVNAGTAPTYRWYINNTLVGNNTDTFSTRGLLNGDVVSCELTSNALCATPKTVTSNKINMRVIPLSFSTARIGATPTDDICEGEQVAVYCYYTNGGATPTFDWYLNGIKTNNIFGSYTSTSFKTGDSIRCVFTNSNVCPEPTITNTEVMTVRKTQKTSISLAVSSGNVIAPGWTVVFTATPSNPGPNPKYIWRKNGQIIAGATSTTYTDSDLKFGDKINVTMKADWRCVEDEYVTSNTLRVNIPTGVNQTTSAEDKIELYPNPNNGQFTLKASIGNSTGDATVYITNHYGQKVYKTSTRVVNGNIKHQFDLSAQLAKGMYMMTIEWEGQLYYQRVVIFE